MENYNYILRLLWIPYLCIYVFYELTQQSSGKVNHHKELVLSVKVAGLNKATILHLLYCTLCNVNQVLIVVRW